MLNCSKCCTLFTPSLSLSRHSQSPPLLHPHTFPLPLNPHHPPSASLLLGRKGLRFMNGFLLRCHGYHYNALINNAVMCFMFDVIFFPLPSRSNHDSRGGGCAFLRGKFRDRWRALAERVENVDGSVVC